VTISPATGALFAVFGENPPEGEKKKIAADGLISADSLTWISQAQAGQAIGMSHHLVFAAGDEAAQKQAAARFSSGDAAAWRQAQIAAGVPWVTAATREMFIPQMINFDCIGGVNFRKGCYVGQEIIARLRYRGKVKRRMFIAESPANEPAAKPPANGAAVFAVGGDEQAVGNVVIAAPREDGFAALISARLDVLPKGIALTPDSPAALQIRPPPYSLDEEE
jgi:folate-binding protein YgfZ